MTNNPALSLSSLDFDGIYAAQKAFLASQSRFKDYNFEGSNMAALLKILAYNTWLNAFYLNMGMAERWVDSASLRNSLVSHAKELNYTPRSVRSASVSLSVSFPTSGIDTLVLPIGTQFSGISATGTKKFVTDKTQTLKSSNNFFSISDLIVYEGFYLTESYIYNSDIEGQTFIISNPGVDISSIESIDVSGVEYTRAESLYSLGPDSKIFFIQGRADEKYEVVFGNGIFGAVPDNGSLIKITYRVSSGEDGNDISSFVLDSDLADGISGSILTPLTITADGLSSGGASAESLESIRFMAPRHFETQERAVSSDDYNTLILKNFSSVKDVYSFGGEDIETDEIAYGKVFLACSSQSGNPISTNDKNSIISFIQRRNSVGITPVILDPDYLKLKLSIKTHIDTKNLTRSIPQIKSLISGGVDAWNVSNLERFGKVFRQSVFSSFLNSLDKSIVSNEVETTLQKSISLPLSLSYAMKIKFGNALQEGSFSSSTFSSGGKSWIITDSVKGVTNNGTLLYLLEDNPSNSTPNYSIIGTINYSSGSASIGMLSVSSYLSSEGIVFSGTPLNQDIYSSGADIIEIDTQNYKIEIIND